jgi:Cys-Gly metallodipeptidase DUG1
MTDLIKLMSTLVTPDGKILIPGVYDDVAPVTPEELSIYEKLDLGMDSIEQAIGASTAIHESVVPTVMARWRYPSLSLHGIEGAFYSSGSKTVIPAKVTGKFSIRLVPDMDPHKLFELVQKHVESEFAKLKTKNKMSISQGHGAKAWLGDTNDKNFTAGIKATEKVWGVTPDLTREGGSIPVTLTFSEITGKSVMLLPVGQSGA